MKRRDDFTPKVIERLRARVGFRCSHPDCRVPTSGPGEGDLDVAHFGRAAHITAAAPGGPRYDETLTREQRRSISNAIWLCANHADEVDDLASRYTAQLLRDWKKQAEAAAAAEKGRPLPHRDDGTKLLVSALTGQATGLAVSAIGNVHQATEVVLNQLDPRIRVETAYRNVTTEFTLHPQETISFKLSVPAPLAKEWRGAYPRLVDHAREVQLPATGIEIQGSPLLTHIWAKENQLHQITFTPHRLLATLKLRVIDLACNPIEQLDDCLGHCALGQKTLRFEGTLFSGLLSLAFDAPHLDGPSPVGKFELERDFGPWTGKPIEYLPFFDRLDRLIDQLLDGWLLGLSMEINGNKLFDGSIDFSSCQPYLQHIRFALDYVKLARKLAKFLGAPLDFNDDIRISNIDFEDLNEIVETIEERRVIERSELRGALNCRISLAENPQLLETISAKRETEMAIQFVENEGAKVAVLGRQLDLPRRVIEIEGVQPCLAQPNPSQHDSVTIEWIPTERFRMQYRFVSDNDYFLADKQ